MTLQVYVVEVTAAVDAAGTQQTFLFSSEGWATRPTDTPANTLVQARLDQPGNLRRELFSGNRTTGAVRPAYGEATLINSDGGLDALAGYGFDGQSFTLRYGPAGGAYPSEFATVLKASLRGAAYDMARVRLMLRDRLELLDRPLSQATFAGTGEEEGGADLVGVRKPLAFGQIYSLRPKLLNKTSLLYSVGTPPTGCLAFATYAMDGQSSLVPAWAQPIPLAPYASSAHELATAAIDPGYYWTYPPLGLLRTGSQPAIDLTCSVGVTAAGGVWQGPYVAKPGTILSQMATIMGLLTQDAADVTALDAARTAFYGWSEMGETSGLEAMSRIASAAQAWFALGADDVLHMGTFDAPAGDPAIELRSHDIGRVERLDGGDVNRLIPIWRATARCPHNWAPQSNFANNAPEDWKAWYRQEWPGQVQSSNAAIKDKHPYAEETTLDVYGGAPRSTPGAGDGGAAARMMTLYGVDRELVRVDLPMRLDLLACIDLASVVRLRFPRYNWTNGKLFRVVAIEQDHGRNTLSLTLWG